MKKLIKVLLVILLVILIAASSLAIWQWKNIKSIYKGVTQTQEAIKESRNDNQLQLLKEIDSYIESDIRTLTDEEKKKLENEETTVVDVYSKVFAEKYEEIKKSAKDDKTTKDELVTGCISELYQLQSKYTAEAEVTISRGKEYYLSLRKTKSASVARAETIKQFTPTVRSVEASCDAEVEKVFSKLEKDLKSIDENTDIVGTIRAAYENEKQLKLSYYANKYLK